MRFVASATEELRQGNEFFSPYADLEARRAFDLHQQLISVYCACTQLLAVVFEVHRAVRLLCAVEIPFHVVHRGEEHADKLVAGVVLALFQRIGESEAATPDMCGQAIEVPCMYP